MPEIDTYAPLKEQLLTQGAQLKYFAHNRLMGISFVESGPEQSPIQFEQKDQYLQEDTTVKTIEKSFGLQPLPPAVQQLLANRNDDSIISIQFEGQDVSKQEGIPLTSTKNLKVFYDQLPVTSAADIVNIPEDLDLNLLPLELQTRRENSLKPMVLEAIKNPAHIDSLLSVLEIDIDHLDDSIRFGVPMPDEEDKGYVHILKMTEREYVLFMQAKILTSIKEYALYSQYHQRFVGLLENIQNGIITTRHNLVKLNQDYTMNPLSPTDKLVHTQDFMALTVKDGERELEDIFQFAEKANENNSTIHRLRGYTANRLTKVKQSILGQQAA